jgi:hypothetical protein
MSSYGDPDPSVETTPTEPTSTGQPDPETDGDTTSGGEPEEPTTTNPQKTD